MPSAPGFDDAHFHARQRLAHRVGAKRLEIVQRDRRAGLGAAVAIGDRDAQIVEKLQRGGLGECAADEQRAQFAAESSVNLSSASARLRPEFGGVARERAIDADQRVAARRRLHWRQARRIAACSPRSQIFQDQRHQAM